jgi:hypothetical protein
MKVENNSFFYRKIAREAHAVQALLNQKKNDS